MIRFSLFKKREPRKYYYVPRYYDPEKEDLERRIRNAKAELGVKDESGEDLRREITFRQAASSTWKPDSAKKQAMAANIRLILILIGLGILFYYLYNKLDIFVEKLMN